MRRQLQRAQSETEKLAAAAENYKRDLLRQRAADAEHEVASLKDRLKESVSDNESAPFQALLLSEPRAQEARPADKLSSKSPCCDLLS